MVLHLWLSVVTLAWLLSSITMNAVGARYDVAGTLARLLSCVGEPRSCWPPFRIADVARAASNRQLVRGCTSWRQISRTLNLREHNGRISLHWLTKLKQPLAAARNNARAALNFLSRKPPELDEVKEALGGVVDDADLSVELR